MHYLSRNLKKVMIRTHQIIYQLAIYFLLCMNTCARNRSQEYERVKSQIHEKDDSSNKNRRDKVFSKAINEIKKQV